MTGEPFVPPPPPHRSWWHTVAQLVLGAAFVAAVGLGLGALLERARQRQTPPGWRIIRPPHDVLDLVIAGDLVWVGGKSGLEALDRVTGDPVTLPKGTPRMSYVRDLLIDRQGRLLAAHDRGVSILDGGIWSTLTTAVGPLPGPANSLCEARDGTLWVGGERGVVRLGTRSTVYTAPEGPGGSGVDVIFEDRDGILWFGSAHPLRGALSRFDGQRWQVFTSAEGLIHDSVNAIMQEESGALWIGLGYASRGGAMRLLDNQWSRLTADDGLAGAKVRSLYQDRDGALWFGSEFDGVAIRAGSTWRVLTPDDGLADPEVRVISQDADGVYWLGTADGVTRIEPSGLRVAGTAEGG